MIESRQAKRGRRFRADFMLRHTRFKSPWFETEAEAKAWEARERAGVEDGVVNTGINMELEPFGALWLGKVEETRMTKGSARSRRFFFQKHLWPALGARKLRTIKARDLEFFFANLHKDGAEASSVNLYMGFVSSMFADAVRWGYIGMNPAAKMKRIRVNQDEVTTLAPDEVATLLAYSRYFWPQAHDLILFALSTGARLGECLGLEWAAVDIPGRTVTIRRIFDPAVGKAAERTKGRRSRRVPLNAQVSELLTARARARGESDVVFPDVTYREMVEQFRPLLRDAGLRAAEARGATFHTLRHTFASQFMMKGGDIYVLQQILGHATITQTEKYSHFSPSHLAGETDRIGFETPKREALRLVKAGKP